MSAPAPGRAPRHADRALRGALATADAELAAAERDEQRREANRARRAAARRGEAVHDEDPEREREQLAAALPAIWTPLRMLAGPAPVECVRVLQAALALAHYSDGRAQLRQEAFPTGRIMVRRRLA